MPICAVWYSVPHGAADASSGSVSVQLVVPLKWKYGLPLKVLKSRAVDVRRAVRGDERVEDVLLVVGHLAKDTGVVAVARERAKESVVFDDAKLVSACMHLPAVSLGGPTLWK